MKYVNQINILLAAVGIVVVVYTFALTFLASQPTEFIWVEPGAPGADLDSAGRRLSGTDTSAAFRGSATTQTSAIETLPADRGRSRPGFQASPPTDSAGPRVGFARPSGNSPSRSLEVQQRARELNRVEVGRGGGVVPMNQVEQFGQTETYEPPSRIGEMNGPAETQQAQQPAQGVKRDATTDPPPPPVRASNQ
ncbi:MAG TPA: hypothetical protein VMY18_10855 [Acidobacteriota bacterium]|nr:hypothetical protein [Acidobacteriota bacterium]